jgi:hypothetical protein
VPQCGKGGLFMGLLYIGIGLIAAGIVVLIIYIRFIMTAESVIGEIIEIHHVRPDTEANLNRFISVSYMARGVEHKKSFNEHSTFMRVGKKIKLYYRKDKPESAKTAGGNLLVAFVLLAVGIAFIVVSIYFPEFIGTS